jgi:hypothetical protein
MSDRNFASYTGEGVIENREFLPPLESGRWDDVLKFSRGKYRIRGRVSAYGGFENACDINNHSEVIVEDGAELILVGGEQAGLVVKGNSVLRTEGTGKVVFKPGHRSRCDVLKDDWSDQSDHSSTVEGNLERVDGNELRVVWGRGARPKVSNGQIQPIWWWIIGAHAWNALRGLFPMLLLAVAMAGCVYLPSGWTPLKNPLEKKEQAQDRVEAARTDLEKAAQVAALKADFAAAKLPPSLASDVTRYYTGETSSLLTQAEGPLLAKEIAGARELIEKLTSEDVTLRAEGLKQREKEAATNAELSERLADMQGKLDAAAARADRFAAQNLQLADRARKLFWIAAGLAGLWVLSQVLTIAARVTPAIAPIASVANAVAAPAIAYAYSRAKSGLERVGTGLAEARQKMPEITEQIVSLIDSHTDKDHQTLIASAATQAGAPPRE